MDGLEGEVRALRDEVNRLSHILIEGNGREPITTRMALVERAVEDVASELRQLREALAVSTAEKLRGRWALVTTVAAGLLSLASAAVTAVLAAHR